MTDNLKTDKDYNIKIENDLLQKVILVKCPLHPNYQSQILHVAAGATSHRACLQCLLSIEVPTSAALDLNRLFQMTDDEDCILSNYPPLGSFAIYNQLESIQQYSVTKTIEQIEQYVVDLKSSFENIIDRLKTESIGQIEELGQQRRKVLDLYKSLSETNKLKEAVLKASETKNENLLHDLIVKKCNDSAINARKLQSMINQFEVNKQKFSLQIVNESSENTRNAMRNISFFTSTITPLIPLSILQEFQLAPSNLWNSATKTEISRKENNQLDIKCIQSNENRCRLYSSNVLDNNAHYIFRMAFHQEATKGPPQFSIGLVNELDKNKGVNRNRLCYLEHSKNCRINKIIKGIALNSAADAKNIHKEVEMRVHLASQTIKVADFPNFTNVVELSNKTVIRESSKYCLLIELGGFLNNHVTLMNAFLSEEFDASM